MHIDGTGPVLSCDHSAHTDTQLIECLAQSWGVTVPQLIAIMAALVLSHTERAAIADTTPIGVISLLPELPGRECDWCHRQLPPGIHHSRKYCPDTDCRRHAYNAWQRAGRPTNRKSTA